MSGVRPNLVRVNLGCGATPTPGWVNIDNSPTVWLAGLPWLWPLVPANQRSFARAARDAGVRPGSATRLKLPSNSVEVLYSSHMMEHMDRAEVATFLAEARRVLAPGGIIRLAVPDIANMIADYISHRDADRFVASTWMGTDRPRSAVAWARHLIVGPRHHLWMYDGPSLVKALQGAGFDDAAVVPVGETRIPAPGPLDLAERYPESVFVEATNPRGRIQKR